MLLRKMLSLAVIAIAFVPHTAISQEPPAGDSGSSPYIPEWEDMVASVWPPGALNGFIPSTTTNSTEVKSYLSLNVIDGNWIQVDFQVNWGTISRKPLTGGSYVEANSSPDVGVVHGKGQDSSPTSDFTETAVAQAFKYYKWVWNPAGTPEPIPAGTGNGAGSIAWGSSGNGFIDLVNAHAGAAVAVHIKLTCLQLAVSHTRTIVDDRNTGASPLIVGGSLTSLLSGLSLNFAYNVGNSAANHILTVQPDYQNEAGASNLDLVTLRYDCTVGITGHADDIFPGTARFEAFATGAVGHLLSLYDGQ